ncbi:OmpA family protein [Flexithrix dorotheae]|uniref:OmpA family protein n=1 Tax=Flexithrix dorotheae TaxID=70993 RepID=UPI00036BC4BA|nr:OmpA family protein [Flexithrix dorotheae]
MKFFPNPCNFLLLALLFSFNLSFAQNNEQLLKKGIHEYNDGNYKIAIEYLEKVLAAEPENLEAKLYVSKSYLAAEDDQSKKALSYLKSLMNSDIATADEDYYLDLADAYFKQKSFDDAVKTLDNIKGENNNSLDISYLRSKIENAKSYYSTTSKGIVVKNLGAEVNSDASDYSAVMFKDQRSILFTSRRENDNYPQAKDGYNYEMIYKASMDNDDQWSSPVIIDAENNKKRHDATVQLINGKNKIVYFRDGDLYISNYNNGEWDEGEKIKAVSTAASDPHCFISKTGNTIVFSTNYYSDNESLDLYLTKKDKKGKWTEPVALSHLNSEFDEDSPFIGDDGSLYFSSKGHKSMGGFDVFKAQYNKAKDIWEAPVNLGLPINSISDDIYFNIHEKFAYLSSSREGGFGGLDIYSVYFFDQVKLEGRVIDESGKALANAHIKMMSNGNVFESITDDLGNYTVFAPFGEDLKTSIFKNEKEIHKETLSLKLSLRNSTKNTYDFVVNSEVSAMDKDGNAKTLDYFAINKKDNNNLRNSEEFRNLLNSGFDPNAMGDFNPEKELVNKSFFKAVEISFLEDEVKIEGKYQRQLIDVVNLMNNHPKLKMEIVGHAERGKSSRYNLIISEKRVDTVVKFLKAQGISKDRIIVLEGAQNSTNDKKVTINLK